MHSHVRAQKLAKETVTLVKPVTPRGRILDIYNPKHTCTHVIWHPLDFGGVPMLRAAGGAAAVALLFHHMPCETATPPPLYMAGAACISW